MPRPVCVPCRVEMTVERNGVPVRDQESPGFPSTYWSGDRFECPNCGAQIITQFGLPIDPPTEEMEHNAIEFSRRNLLIDPEPSPVQATPQALRRMADNVARGALVEVVEVFEHYEPKANQGDVYKVLRSLADMVEKENRK